MDPSYDQRHEKEFQNPKQWKIEDMSGNQKIRHQMEMEDKQLHLGAGDYLNKVIGKVREENFKV